VILKKYVPRTIKGRNICRGLSSAKFMEEKNIKREYPVKLEIDYPERSSRLLALIAIPWFFLKIILLLPHIIILYFLNLAVIVAIWLSYWVILFKGRYPKAFFDLNLLTPFAEPFFAKE